MPFTLAHPAAILPLRRYCPRFLNFPALVAGSLSPDLGYCFGVLNLDEFSHTLRGGILFCLPAGVVMLGFFYGLRRPVVESLPERYRDIFLPLCRRPLGSPWLVLASLLVGIGIHLLLDAFTHKQGWLVLNLPLLQTPLFSAGGHTFRLFNLLWYACSFGGIVWLYLAWEQWRCQLAGPAPKMARRGKLVKAVLAAVLMLPIEVIHHLVPAPGDLILMAGYGALLVIGAVWRIETKDVNRR
jgi:hypothetical protein